MGLPLMLEIAPSMGFVIGLINLSLVWEWVKDLAKVSATMTIISTI